MTSNAFLKSMAYRAAGYALPVLSPFQNRRSPDGVGVLMAHGVYPEAKINGVPVPVSGVLLDTVETNLLALKGYSFVSMDEAADMIAGRRPMRKKCLAVTFDDSLKAHVDVIAPKLKEWGIPATFYISTDIMETKRPYWWLRLEYAVSKMENKPVTATLPDGEKVAIHPEQKWEMRRKIAVKLFSAFKPAQCDKVAESVESQVGLDWQTIGNDSPYAASMTWDDVRQLSSMGFTVGSHTHTHPNLTLLDGEELRGEFEGSRQTLEKQCGKPCRHLSYPHGKQSQKVCDAARAAGFLTAVTTDSSHWNPGGSDPFRLQRFSIPKLAYKLPVDLARLRNF
jgi:peptidoglycan/xylan/chitin deacetylase (PgdA/CDA1 family)